MLSPTTLRWLAVAGIAAPVGFVASALTQSLLRADHALLTDPISALAAGPDGWIQNVTFAAAGVLLVAFAAGLHGAVRPSRAGALGPVLVALFGVGLLGAAAFPAADAASVFVEDQVPVSHVVAGVVAFLSVGPAALLLSWRLSRDSEWRDLAGYVRAVSVTLLVLFLAGGVLVRPAGAPFHDWLGVFQWVYAVVVWYPCVVVLAVRLLRVARELPRPGLGGGAAVVPGEQRASQ
ncbi:MAG: DUF998 domain-containing protein [bacterium]